MIDAESAIYQKLSAAMKADNPDLTCINEPVASTESFPCLSIVEADNASYEGSMADIQAERHAVLTYEIAALANGGAGAKDQCKALMARADDEMRQMGFTRLSCTQQKDQSGSYRMIARFRGVIGEDYTIYRR